MPARRRVGSSSIRAGGIALLVLLALSPGIARAKPAGTTADPGAAPRTAVAAPELYRRHEIPLAARGPYLDFMGALALGSGLRFNNPFRLSTELGKTGESLSLTAPYVDLSAAALIGSPDGLQQGLALHVSAAVQGVGQEVLTPSYIALVRLPPRWLVYGRAGLPIVIDPDATFGLELAGGGAWMASAGLGITAELVSDIYYGAATATRPITTFPVMSLQLGVLIDYEVLP